jgi:pyruvate dehydrogenase (quinone)
LIDIHFDAASFRRRESVAVTVGEYLLRRLIAWGVKRVFGHPGDGINGIIGAFREVPELRFIQVRHEEMAAFMACVQAKFAGEVGVCLATSGPGAIHLLIGLYDAKMDHQPVVAIVRQQARSAIGGDYQQEVDLISLFKDVAHEYVHMCSTPAQIRQLVDRAVRTARAERGVTCIIVPKDVQEMPYESPPHKHGTVHTSIGFHSPSVLPKRAGLERAAEVLNSSERVAMLVGQGALHATEEVMHTAELLGAGVAKALLGKAVLPDRLPYVTGSIGLLGTKPSWDMMMECDALLMVGSNFPYSEFLPEEGQARGVQIDIDGRLLGVRYPMEVNLTGDSKETLQALIPLLERKQNRRWRERLEAEIRQWWQVVEARVRTPANPVNPQRIFWEMSNLLPDRAILCCDSGSSANWFARDIQLRPGMMASLSGTLATMGSGIPYALSAKMNFPDRPAVAFVGDGAMQMNGNNVLITVSRHFREWSNPSLVVLVLNNHDLNQVTWELRVESGDPKLDASQVLPAFSFAHYAEQLGLLGLRIERPEDIGPVLREAFAARRPVVIDALTDPEVPPLPPHIQFDQAKKLTKAFLKVDPNWRAMVREIYREVTAGWKAKIRTRH